MSLSGRDGPCVVGCRISSRSASRSRSCAPGTSSSTTPTIGNAWALAMAESTVEMSSLLSRIAFRPYIATAATAPATTSPMAAACRRCVCVARRVPKKTATATATAMPMMTPRFSNRCSRLASRLTRARIAVLYSKHCATRTVQELEGTRRLQSSHAVCCAVSRVGPAP